MKLRPKSVKLSGPLLMTENEVTKSSRLACSVPPVSFASQLPLVLVLVVVLVLGLVPQAQSASPSPVNRNTASLLTCLFCIVGSYENREMRAQPSMDVRTAGFQPYFENCICRKPGADVEPDYLHLGHGKCAGPRASETAYEDPVSSDRVPGSGAVQRERIACRR